MDRRIEQHRAANTRRMGGRELQHEPAAERGADPVGLADPQRVGGVDEIGDVRRVRPRRFPVRASVAAQVRRDDVETLRPMLLRQPAVALAVSGDAVQADERRRSGIAPLVHTQLHSGVSSPLPDGP